MMQENGTLMYGCIDAQIPVLRDGGDARISSRLARAVRVAPCIAVREV